MKNEEINYMFGKYKRKSSVPEDKQVQSLENQERELSDFAERLNLGVKMEWAEEKSAFKVGREKFEEMLGALEKGKINALLVIHANRLARNAIDASRIIDAMDRKKLLCIKTPSRTYFNTSIDKMMLAIELILSKKDSDDKSDSVKVGQKTKAIKGYPHGLAALGYTNDKSEEKGNRKWLVNQTLFKIAKRTLEEFLTGNYSIGTITKYAREVLQFRTPKHKKIGGELIGSSRMHTFLRDPINAGFFSQNGIRYELHPSLPRMISEEQHYKICRMLSSKHHPKVYRHNPTFSGYIKSPDNEFIGPDFKSQLICDCKNKFSHINRTHCPKCGKLIEKLEHPKYLHYKFYYNVARKKARKKYRNIDESVITNFVLKYFEENLKLSAAMAEWSKKYLKEIKDKEVNENLVVVDNKNNLREEIKRKKKKLLNLLVDEVIGKQEYDSGIKDLDLQERDLDRNTERGIDWYSKAEQIVDLTQEFVKIMSSDDTEAKRRVLSALGSNLTWDEEKLNVINRKSIDILIHGLKTIQAEKPQFEPEKYFAVSSPNRVFDPQMITMLRGLDSNQRPIA